MLVEIQHELLGFRCVVGGVVPVLASTGMSIGVRGAQLLKNLLDAAAEIFLPYDGVHEQVSLLITCKVILWFKVNKVIDQFGQLRFAERMEINGALLKMLFENGVVVDVTTAASGYPEVGGDQSVIRIADECELQVGLKLIGVLTLKRHR